MRAVLIWSLILLATSSLAVDLEFPPCEQINPALCSSDRFKSQCPSICGGGGGSSLGSNNGKEQDKPKDHGNGKTTTAKPEPSTTEDDSSGSNNNKDEDETTMSTSKSEQKTSSTTKSSTNENKPTQKPSGGSSGSCDKIKPCVDISTANAGFLSRCKAKGIKETCLEKCRYDVTFDELKKAMLGGKCPIAGMRDFLKCGANNNDNRMCCDKTGVLEGKRAFCFPFCNPEGDTWPTQKEALKYMPCASQMAQIMQCHWAGITP